MARRRNRTEVEIRHRWAEEVLSATERAPAAQQRRAAALRDVATERKLLLLECALIRYAPFSESKQTIWQLLPAFTWFQLPKESALSERLSGHDAIEILERQADGCANPSEISDANTYFHWAEYAAEADRFGYDEAKAIGSKLRYGVASWLVMLSTDNFDRKSVLDYYLTAYPGRYYAWSVYQQFPPEHHTAALALIDDVFGNPFRPVAFRSEWRTETAVLLAQRMYESRDFNAMPILADALQDAGCDSDDILAHCREPHAIHVRGCWVVDLVLGKS